jgi:hypothetical protein
MRITFNAASCHSETFEPFNAVNSHRHPDVGTAVCQDEVAENTATLKTHGSRSLVDHCPRIPPPLAYLLLFSTTYNNVVSDFTDGMHRLPHCNFQDYPDLFEPGLTGELTQSL